MKVGIMYKWIYVGWMKGNDEGGLQESGNNELMNIYWWMKMND